VNWTLGDDPAFDWMAGRRAFVAGRPFGSLREVGRAVSQAGSCSCTNGVVVKDDTGRRGWKGGIEGVVVVRRLSAALEEVASVVAVRNQDCMVEEGHRRAGTEECSAVAEQAVDVCSAAARAQAWAA
jgi:hypothetical protein